jgi:hypothetical protein
MKHFIVNLLIFLFPLIVFLFGIDSVITEGLKKTGWDEYKEWNEILSGSINADLIINGSSRPLTAISPAILDSTLNLTSYNLSLNGHEFYMEYIRFLLYVEFNKAPKIIIQALDRHSLKKSRTLPNPDAFLPYLDYELIKTSSNYYNNHFNYFDFYLPGYKYLYKYKIQFIGFCEYFNLKHFDYGKYKGFQKMDIPWDGLTEKFIAQNPNGIEVKLDTTAIKLFESFLRKSKRTNSKIILVYSPELNDYQNFTINRSEIFNLYKNLANKYDLEFLDYSKDSLSLNKAFFYNSQHLNKIGSEVFSRKLSEDIRNILILDE